jgi:polysaccharide biosynthesis protein PslJ
VRLVPGEGSRLPVAPLLTLGVGVSIAYLGVATTTPVTKIAAAAAAVLVVGATYRWALKWPSLTMLMVAVVLLIPFRYSLPASLPFQLDPYRVLVAFIAIAWLTSLLIDPRIKIRRTGFEGPLGLYLAAAALSLIFNLGRVEAVAPVMTKTLMFFATYLLIVYAVPSVIRKWSDIDAICKILVSAGAFVALAAVVESRTHYNFFDHLSTMFPFLKLGTLPFDGHDLTGASRGGKPRAYASAEHPIALGAALTMLMPIAVYLALRTMQRRWWLAGAALLLGLFATVSRTGFLMLFVLGAFFVVHYRSKAKRYWWALIPAVGVIHFAVPGTLGTIYDSFFPKGGLIAQQTNQHVGSGRLATLKPVLRSELYPEPIFGEGLYTRVVAPSGSVRANSPILDDQWGGVVVETGIVGAAAFAWLFIRAVTLMRRRMRSVQGPESALMLGLGASIAAFGIGMFTFDAFSFVQVTFLFYFLLGLSGAVANLVERPRLSEAPARGQA